MFVFLGNYYNKLKGICLLLALLLVCGTLFGCSSRPIKASEQQLRTVGSVGEYDVAYEELYFLAKSYRDALTVKYGEYSELDADTAKRFDEELRENVYSGIISNYAILTLCDSEGVELDEKELEKRVQKYVDSKIATDFGGSRSEYRKSLKEYGITDSYFRFNAKVDLLYSDLLTSLLQNGKIVEDDAEVMEIIKSEFVRTWHIMISNDEGDDVAANRARAEEALAKYKDGSMKMYQLIGSTYNEDYSLTTLDGFYFTKGSMQKEYEEAAFALEIGEMSDVVESRWVDMNGESRSCFYLIQRLELEDEYINSNFVELESKYRDATVYEMLEGVKEKLSFFPNEYASSLNLTTLEAPRESSSTLVAVIIAVCALAVVGGAVVLIMKNKKSAAIKK